MHVILDVKPVYFFLFTNVIIASLLFVIVYFVEIYRQLQCENSVQTNCTISKAFQRTEKPSTLAADRRLRCR